MMFKNVYNLFKCILIVIVIIFLVSGVVYASTLYMSLEVSYDITYSKLNSNTVQGALDELYIYANGISGVGADGLAKYITDLYNKSEK